MSKFDFAEIVAKPGSADALRALLVPFAEKSRHEPGCKLYTLLEVELEPGHFLTYERWTDKAALQVHMTRISKKSSRSSNLFWPSRSPRSSWVRSAAPKSSDH